MQPVPRASFGPEWPRRTQPLRRGVALADAIIGGVLLAIGLAVLVSLSSRALDAQLDGQMRLMGSWLADAKLNLMLAEGPSVFRDRYDLSGEADWPWSDHGFVYHIQMDDLGERSPFHVTVTVDWPGAKLPVIVETLIAKRQGEEIQPPREPREIIDRIQRWDEKINAHEYEE